MPDGVESKITLSALPAHLQLLGIKAFCNCTSIGMLAMSDFLHDIPNYCFQGCTKLELPENYYFQGVYTIGMRAFENCHRLSTFNAKQDNGSYALSGTLTSIGLAAFRYCENLHLEALPVWTLKEINAEAFRDCGYIKLATELAQPSLTTSESDKVKWGQNIFAGCTLYKELEDANGNNIGIESSSPRIVLKYAAGKYDINPNVFGDSEDTCLQVSHAEFGEPFTYTNNIPVYREN